MAVDLIGRLDRRVTQPEHHVLEAFILSTDHSEGNRVAERVRCDVLWITPALTGDERAHIGCLSGLLHRRRTEVLLTREIKTDELASQYNVSDQAVTERLRRGMTNVFTHIFVLDDDDDDAAP